LLKIMPYVIRHGRPSFILNNPTTPILPELPDERDVSPKLFSAPNLISAKMADLRHSTDGPSPLSQEGYDESLLPDFHREFLSEAHLQAFAQALSAPEPSPSTDDLPSPIQSTSSFTNHSTASFNRSPSISQNGVVSPSRTSTNNPRSKTSRSASQSNLFITAQNDWAPINPKKPSNKGRRKGDKKKGSKTPRRSRDETREGYLYTLLKWPLLGIVSAWVAGLGASYLLTRLYIWLYGM
jgi:hypothetical protein